MKRKRYEEAGVNVNAGYEMVKKIKDAVASTDRPGVVGGIGSFGGRLDASDSGFRHGWRWYQAFDRPKAESA